MLAVEYRLNLSCGDAWSRLLTSCKYGGLVRVPIGTPQTNQLKAACIDWTFSGRTSLA